MSKKIIFPLVQEGHLNDFQSVIISLAEAFNSEMGDAS